MLLVLDNNHPDEEVRVADIIDFANTLWVGREVKQGIRGVVPMNLIEEIVRPPRLLHHHAKGC